MCQNEDPKSAVFVGLLASSFENLPSLGSNGFLADGPDWHLGSKDVNWCFDVHSLHAVMCLPITSEIQRIELLLDNVMKKTLVDLQQTFPDIPCVSQILSGGRSLRLGIPREWLSIPSRITIKVEVTLVDW